MVFHGKATDLGKQESSSVVYMGSTSRASAVRPHSQHLSRRHLRRRGVALIWTGLMMLVMILFVGLSIDAGKLALNLHQLQNSADAAALTGALYVKVESPAVTREKTRLMGLENTAEGLDVTLRTAAQPEPFTGDEASFDILIGRWVRYNDTFVPTLDAPNAVKTIARRHEDLDETERPPLRLIFGPIVNVDTANAAREAVAFCNNSDGAGLIVLSSTAEPGLKFTGTANLDIDGGGIHVNSTAIGHHSSDGAWISGNALLDAGFINVVGGITPPPDNPSWEGIFDGGDDMVYGFPVMDYLDKVQPIDDPLAAQLEYDIAPYVDNTTWDRLQLPELIENGTFPTRQAEGDPLISSTSSLPPGYYPYGIRLTTAGETITLDPTLDPDVPPIYIFGGGRPSDSECGLYVNGGNLIGEGVTCYVTKSFNTNGSNFGDKYGVTHLRGNGTIRLLSPGDQLRADGNSAADVDGLEGIAIWQDSQNPNDAHFNGGGDLTISGTLYFPDPIHLNLEGDLGDTGNQILCGSADISGTATINVNYDGRNSGDQSRRCSLVW